MVNFFSSQEVASLDLDVTLYQLMPFFHGQGTLLVQVAWQREWLGIIGNEILSMDHLLLVHSY